MTSDGLRAATTKMREAGVPELAISVFAAYHRQLRSEVTGTIPEEDRHDSAASDLLRRVGP